MKEDLKVGVFRNALNQVTDTKREYQPRGAYELLQELRDDFVASMEFRSAPERAKENLGKGFEKLTVHLGEQDKKLVEAYKANLTEIDILLGGG